jgi:NAD(P)-dependent dehydrogenase (short-subunit alcohol dehydrogenase family)
MLAITFMTASLDPALIDPARSLAGRVAVVTGGYGVIGGSLASSLTAVKVKVVIIGRRLEAAEAKAEEIRQQGGDAMAVAADVADEAQVRAACSAILGRWNAIDILVNAAGGNVARSRNDTRPIFEVPMDAFDEVLRLNLHSTVVPSLVFGEVMAARASGVILNISSMAALPQALTGTMGYSIAKAGIDNFTRWLSVDLMRRYGSGIRVNALAPGFFIGNQNRSLLLNDDGTPTERGGKIIARTPMGRFGRVEELIGPALWLCSDAASFVTGVVVPIDGGFSVFSGV